jgi:hypothetical protein
MITSMSAAGEDAEQRLTRARTRLSAAGAAYEEALSRVAATREALDPLIVEAAQAGMEPWEIEKLSRLSHQTVRNIRHAAGLPPAPRGGARRRGGAPRG